MMPVIVDVVVVVYSHLFNYLQRGAFVSHKLLQILSVTKLIGSGQL